LTSSRPVACSFAPAAIAWLAGAIDARRWPLAALFVAVSLLSNFIKGHFGITGLYTLAAVVGITDIDPFVLNLAQGGAGGLSSGVLGGAILIAASSNNLLKAVYAVAFAGWRASLPSVAALVALAVAGIGAGFLLAHG